jgi:NADH-quinone oxidoreductase subunit K
MTVGLNAFILVAGLLFAIGLLGVILRKNTLVIYMSLELMLNAVNLALVAFSRYNGTMDGNLFVFFIITVAAAEVALGLAIIVALFRLRQSVMVDQLTSMSR